MLITPKQSPYGPYANYLKYLSYQEDTLTQEARVEYGLYINETYYKAGLQPVERLTFRIPLDQITTVDVEQSADKYVKEQLDGK